MSNAAAAFYPLFRKRLSRVMGTEEKPGVFEIREGPHNGRATLKASGSTSTNVNTFDPSLHIKLMKAISPLETTANDP